MIRKFPLSEDNKPVMRRYSITYHTEISSYELQTDGVPVSWALLSRSNVIAGGDAYIIKSGTKDIGLAGAGTVRVDFDSPFAGTDYTISTSVVNIADTEPSIYATVVESKDVNGFDVLLSGLTDTDNYKLSWSAIYIGTASPGIIEGSGTVGEITITNGVMSITLDGFNDHDQIILDVIYR